MCTGGVNDRRNSNSSHQPLWAGTDRRPQFTGASEVKELTKAKVTKLVIRGGIQTQAAPAQNPEIGCSLQEGPGHLPRAVCPARGPPVRGGRPHLEAAVGSPRTPSC